MIDKKKISYWHWFIFGSGGKAGFRRIINKWLIFHFLIGVGLAYIVPIELSKASNTVLLPLAGILIGLCFAWAGNAQVLLQSTEIEEMALQHGGGFIEYVYTYQSAILSILLTLISWALAGFEIFDKVWPLNINGNNYFIIKSLLFTLSSLTVRECWHVVLGAQWMLILQHALKNKKSN